GVRPAAVGGGRRRRLDVAGDVAPRRRGLERVGGCRHRDRGPAVAGCAVLGRCCAGHLGRAGGRGRQVRGGCRLARLLGRGCVGGGRGGRGRRIAADRRRGGLRGGGRHGDGRTSAELCPRRGGDRGAPCGDVAAV